VGFGGHSGLSLFNRGEHAFTESQAFSLSHAPAEGKPELAHLNGESAEVITELLHRTFLARRYEPRIPTSPPGSNLQSLASSRRLGCFLMRRNGVRTAALNLGRALLWSAHADAQEPAPDMPPPIPPTLHAVD
jgi:hypothetical protein